MNTFFSDKIILWRKMAKIWLKIWLKVKENGTKKIKLAKMVAKEKEILLRTLDGVYAIETSSLRLVWTKYESYILHTSAAMYTFQNLNTGINDKV